MTPRLGGAPFSHAGPLEALEMTSLSPGIRDAQSSRTGGAAMVEAIRDQWAIVVAVILLAALLAWLGTARQP
jgi:hypothetical protein